VIPLLPVAALRDLASRLNIELISNDENLGVATALNQGVSQNRAEDYVWALLFDHDTDPLDPMVETLTEVYDNFKQKDKLAVVASNYYYDANCYQVRQNLNLPMPLNG